jgi:hypothetical protein
MIDSLFRHLPAATLERIRDRILSPTSPTRC